MIDEATQSWEVVKHVSKAYTTFYDFFFFIISKLTQNFLLTLGVFLPSRLFGFAFSSELKHTKKCENSVQIKYLCKIKIQVLNEMEVLFTSFMKLKSCQWSDSSTKNTFLLRNSFGLQKLVALIQSRMNFNPENEFIEFEKLPKVESTSLFSLFLSHPAWITFLCLARR